MRRYFYPENLAPDIGTSTWRLDVMSSDVPSTENNLVDGSQGSKGKLPGWVPCSFWVPSSTSTSLIFIFYFVLFCKGNRGSHKDGSIK